MKTYEPIKMKSINDIISKKRTELKKCFNAILIIVFMIKCYS